MEHFRTYLGDGAFVSFDGIHAVLTTEYNGVVTNRICLGPTEWATFGIWMAALLQQPSPGKARQLQAIGEAFKKWEAEYGRGSDKPGAIPELLRVLETAADT